jgi:Flp pilus assembly pilin Flp
MMSLVSQVYDYYLRPYFGEKGQDLVEYALLLAIVVAIGWLIWDQQGLKKNLADIFNNASSVTANAAAKSVSGAT